MKFQQGTDQVKRVKEYPQDLNPIVAWRDNPLMLIREGWDKGSAYLRANPGSRRNVYAPVYELQARVEYTFKKWNRLKDAPPTAYTSHSAFGPLAAIDHWHHWRRGGNSWLVSQPYCHGADTVLDVINSARLNKLRVEFAPDPFSNWWNPGHALLFVYMPQDDWGVTKWPQWHEGNVWTQYAINGTGPVAERLGETGGGHGEREAAQIIELIEEYRTKGIGPDLLKRLHAREHEQRFGKAA